MKSIVAPFVLVAACSAPPAPDRPPVAPTEGAALAPSEPAPPPAPSASASPPADAAPTYDLAADVAERRRIAREELGENAFVETLADVFVVATPARATGIGAAQLLERATAAYFHDRFPTKPKHALSVYLFASAPPYEGYCRARWNEACYSPYGFFHPVDRTIVLNAGPGIGTLTHELVHPILEDDFPGAPTWLDEGVASLFEAPILPRDGEIHGAAKNWRQPLLVATLARPEHAEATMAGLFGMSDETFRDGRESLHYATARSFVAWLDGQDKLWPFYRAFRASDDPTGKKAFAEVMGRTPDEAEASWERWARTR